MSNLNKDHELALTPINGSADHDWSTYLADFGAHLRSSGSSPVTAETYERRIRTYLAYFNEARTQFATPQLAFAAWQSTDSMRRLTGYALRSYELWLRDFAIADVCFGASRRLPAGSRPNPQPMSQRDFLLICRTARRILPRESGLSLRAFVLVLHELACEGLSFLRGTKSIGAQGCCAWMRGAFLPLSTRAMRVLRLLRRRSSIAPWMSARGQSLSAASLSYLFKRTCRACALPTRRLHHLRHTRLSAVANTPGLVPALFLAVSGHKDWSSARYYVRPHVGRLASMLAASRQLNVSGRDS
jgi:hypothetical protein